MLVLKGLVGLHRTIQLQLLQHYWLGHRLGLLWYWMVCLRNEQRLFCRFWDCIQVLHFGLFYWPWWPLHFFWGIPVHSSIIFKSKDITLPTKVHLVKAMVFPVVVYGCGSWTVKKAECWRIDVFELWCWRRLLRVPWTARSSNHSILKEISPGCSLEGMMLKLKL